MSRRVGCKAIDGYISVTQRECGDVNGITIERGGGIALWRQIGKMIEGEIGSGAYGPGERLAPEIDLAARFAVNRHTVRRAVADLAARGILRVEQGRGTFVQENVIDYALGHRTRFSENVVRSHGAPSGRLIRTATLPAPESIASALQVAVGIGVTLIERVGEADGRPINIGSHYFPAERFADIVTAYRDGGSITRALAACGVPDYTRKTTRVTARMPTVEDARLLQQPAGRPILQTEAINVDPRGVPVEYGIGRFASDRVQLLIES